MPARDPNPNPLAQRHGVCGSLPHRVGAVVSRGGAHGRVFATLALFSLFAIGCAAKPVLYPNAHRTQVGALVAENDVAECLAAAKSAGSEAGRARDVARKTFGGAAFGAITGVVIGAITGDPGRGAAVGGAGGGTAGFLRGLGGPRPDEITRRFTERCLRERGYDPVGWR